MLTQIGLPSLLFLLFIRQLALLCLVSTSQHGVGSCGGFTLPRFVSFKQGESGEAKTMGFATESRVLVAPLPAVQPLLAGRFNAVGESTCLHVCECVGVFCYVVRTVTPCRTLPTGVCCYAEQHNCWATNAPSLAVCCQQALCPHIVLATPQDLPSSVPCSLSDGASNRPCPSVLFDAECSATGAPGAIPLPSSMFMLG